MNSKKVHDPQVCTIHNERVGLSASYQLEKMLMALELHSIFFIKLCTRLHMVK